MTGVPPESPNNGTSTFFNTVHLLPNNLRFEHEGAKLASCPGRNLTCLRPSVKHIRSNIRQKKHELFAIVYRFSFGELSISNPFDAAAFRSFQALFELLEKSLA